MASVFWLLFMLQSVTYDKNKRYTYIQCEDVLEGIAIGDRSYLNQKLM